MMKKVLTILLMLMSISLGATAQTKCKATTQEGNRCTRVAKRSGYCTQHYNMHVKGGGVAKQNHCHAATAKGARCRNTAQPNSDWCHIHKDKHERWDGTNKPRKSAGKPEKAQNANERCHATTKKGTQCKLKAIPGTNYCPTHTK